MLALAKAMPIANAAKRLGEHDTRLWRIVEHYVWRAVEALDLSQVRRIAADETSARRGYMARRKVIYAADGKDAATVKEFADFLKAHGGKREAGGEAIGGVEEPSIACFGREQDKLVDGDDASVMSGGPSLDGANLVGKSKPRAVAHSFAAIWFGSIVVGGEADGRLH